MNWRSGYDLLNLFTLVLSAALFLVIFWVMFRRAVVWDNLGRSLTVLFLVLGLLFAWGAVGAALVGSESGGGNQSLTVRVAIRVVLCAVEGWALWALLAFDWPPVPPGGVRAAWLRFVGRRSRG